MDTYIYYTTDNFQYISQAIQIGLLLGFFIAIFYGNNGGRK